MTTLGQFQDQLDRLQVCQELTVDTVRNEVWLDGRAVSVTGQEFRTLSYLASRPGEPVSRTQLQHALWGATSVSGGRTIDSYVASLRAKIAVPGLITTVRSVGYVFNRVGSSQGSKPFVVVLRN